MSHLLNASDRKEIVSGMQLSRLGLFVFTMLTSSMTLVSLAQQHTWVYEASALNHRIDPSYSAALADGGVLACGLSFSDTSFSVIRLDTSGAVVWLRSLRLPGVAVSLCPTSSVELPNGDLMLCAPPTQYNDMPYDLLVIRLQASGQPIWSKKLILPNSGFGGILRAVMQVLPDGSLMVYVDQAASFVIIHMDSSGGLIWSHRYQPEGTAGSAADLATFHADDSGVIVVRNKWQAPNGGVVATMIDTAGVIQWCHVYYFADHPRAYAVEKDSEGSFLLAGNTYGLGTMHAFVLKIHADGTPYWYQNYWDLQEWLPYTEQVIALPGDEFLLHTGDHFIHATAGGDLISDIRVATNSPVSMWGTIVQANDQWWRLNGRTTYYGPPDWGPWSRSFDMIVPLDAGAECMLGPGQFESGIGDIDSTDVNSIVSSEHIVSIVDQDISDLQLSTSRETLCDFANSIGPVREMDPALHVSPTPNEGLAVLRLASASQVAFRVTVHDSFGRLILSTTLTEGNTDVELDLTAQPPGVYGVELTSGDRHYFARTIVQ